MNAARMIRLKGKRPAVLGEVSNHPWPHRLGLPVGQRPPGPLGGAEAEAVEPEGADQQLGGPDRHDDRVQERPVQRGEQVEPVAGRTASCRRSSRTGSSSTPSGPPRPGGGSSPAAPATGRSASPGRYGPPRPAGCRTGSAAASLPERARLAGRERTAPGLRGSHRTTAAAGRLP